MNEPTPAPIEGASMAQVATSQTVARRRRWEKKFLAELRRTGNHSAAARAAKIDRTVPYKARQDDPAFAEAYQDAIDEACDGLELEARRRAHDGIDEPVIYQGELCGTWVDADGNVVSKDTPGAKLIPLTVKKYSDGLLLALLKAHRPERFKDNVKLEHTGSKGGPIQHQVDAEHDHNHHLDADPDRLAAIFRALAEAAAGVPGAAGPPGDPPADEVHPAPPPPQAGGLPPAGLP
jgi:hypothetical protein